MVMDTTPAILILSPILLPIVEYVGMNPIHFGVMMIVNLAVGFVTPPVGVNLFVASSLTNVPMMQIAKKRNADDRIFHACTASDHIYSGNQSLSAFIRRAKT